MLEIRKQVPSSDNRQKAILWLVFAAILWGLSFPVVQVIFANFRHLLPEAEAYFFTSFLVTYRFGLAAFLMLPYLWLKKIRFTRLEWQQGAELTILGGIGLWLQADGLAYTTATTSAFLTQGYCVLLPLFVAFKTKKMPRLNVWASVLLVVCGVAWLSGVNLRSAHIGRGEIETLGAAVFFTFQILCLENPRYAKNRSAPITFIMFAGIAALFLPLTLAGASSLSEMKTLFMSPSATSLILFLALFCSVIPYGLMNLWQSKISSIEAGLIYSSEPVFTAALVLFLPAWLGALVGHPQVNESLTLALIGGGSLITMANVMVHLKPRVRYKA
jgi:drug/metabolite transporter (DMT)-like permease